MFKRHQLTWLNTGHQLLGRLGSIFLTVLGLLSLTFIISRIIPIDPVLALVGDRASADAYATARADLGLDLPYWQQLYHYLANCLQGDLGISTLTQNPVIADLARVCPATFELATFAMVLSCLTGIPLGILAALRQNTWVDHVVRIISLIGNSISIFWLSLMGLILFYVKLDWLPGPGRLDIYYATIYGEDSFILFKSLWQGNWPVFQNAISHIILPGCILAYYKLALISRMTRSFVLDQLQQEYVLTARIKGLSNTNILIYYVLKNAAGPLLTVVSLSFVTLLEGSTFVEMIFLWPGLGYYLTNALLNADINAVLGATIVIGLLFTCVNMLVDVISRWCDPKQQNVNNP